MKKNNTQIKQAITGEEKCKTYKEMMTRHKTAMKQGFYFEALLIDYAVLEDRLEAFLWAAGVFNDVGSFGLGNKYNKSQLKELYTKCFNEKKSPKLHNISGKIEVCKSLIAFSQEKYVGNDKYLKMLHEGLQKIDNINLNP